MSTSRPAKNMIYSKPTFPNKVMLASLANTFKPCGPRIKPAKSIPIIPGIRSLPSINGENKVMERIIKKITIGSFSGSERSIKNNI
jgi:hypothetical protein